MKKKILSCFLAGCMILTSPAVVFSQAPGSEDTVFDDFDGTNPYILSLDPENGELTGPEAEEADPEDVDLFETDKTDTDEENTGAGSTPAQADPAELSENNPAVEFHFDTSGTVNAGTAEKSDSAENTDKIENTDRIDAAADSGAAENAENTDNMESEIPEEVILPAESSVDPLPDTAEKEIPLSGEPSTDGSEEGGDSDFFDLAYEEPDAGETILCEDSLDGETVFFSDTRLPDNTKLFQDYVDRIMYGKDSGEEPDRAEAKRDNGKILNGLDAAVYQQLQKCVVEVANGQRSSTIFMLSVNSLGLDKLQWTAKELGVSSILNKKGKITTAAQKALLKKITPDMSKVCGALLLEYPYEFYWYDKTNGIKLSYPVIASAGITESGEIVLWPSSGALAFGFSVATEFASDTYKINTSIGASVRSAAGKAAQIVAENAGKSDYEKLAAYKEAVCDLVSYNWDAVYQEPDYGNPWQLIWVFDGNPGTNVVCEGYAKAFQYLCDLSLFHSYVTCYTVTGTLRTGGSPGLHMWNVVKMYGGKNYLVDLTNCDEGMIGADDLLFLVGTAPSDSAKTTYSFPVSEYGINCIYTYDADTLNLYGADELLLSSNYFDSEVIENCAETGNHRTIVTDPAVAATCVNTGLTEGSHCGDCGTVLVARQKVAKLPATYKVTAKSIPLKVGQTTKKIKITGLGKGDFIKKWSSNKPKVASVTGKGVITGKKAGKAVITAKLASGTKVKITVKVQKNAVAAKSITGLPSKLSMKKGKSTTLKPVLKPITSVEKITYTSSNPKVVTVNKKGVLKAVKTGKANITVQAGKKKCIVKVTVKKK